MKYTGYFNNYPLRIALKTYISLIIRYMHKGKFLQYLIKKAGLNQEKVADAIQYSTSKLSRIINNSNPDEKSLFDILGYLEISHEDFMEGLKNFAPGTNDSLDIVELRMRYIREKEQWLNEKAELVNKQHELQGEISRLRDLLRDGDN